MKKIKFINSLGEEFEFSNSRPFILQKFEQTNGVNSYTFKGVNQDGNTYLYSDFKEKDINLGIAVIAQNTFQYANYKDKLFRVFNPKLGEGYLVYQDDIRERKIKCIVEKIPFLVNMTKCVGTGTIALSANDPFWRDLVEQREEIALWFGDFEFDLEITGEGIEMGHREPSLIVNCLNNGDLETGMRIEFKALASLTNPSLFNVHTREFIKINKTMAAGEVISVSTYFGNKQIISKLNGIESNVFYTIDEDSSFLQLNKGDNLFRYNAETGLDNLEVTIYHYDRYIGV
ncbi:phage tail family protein [Acetobacterium wieringae]|uniref:Phage tail family protein n=1 Tax=Acetobacterium wieringae TaxID=52694 RepID=A0ABY6HEJ6_9FIRM|nr:phage tail family protein [Acetobacterium wieringae]UYO62792.1 phage tail family protein [Acetobacterium wieringae]